MPRHAPRGVKILPLAGAGELGEEVVRHIVFEVHEGVLPLVGAAVIEVAPVPDAGGHGLDELVSACFHERLVIGEEVKIEGREFTEYLRRAIPLRRRTGKERMLERRGARGCRFRGNLPRVEIQQQLMGLGQPLVPIKRLWRCRRVKLR